MLAETALADRGHQRGQAPAHALARAGRPDNVAATR